MACKPYLRLAITMLAFTVIGAIAWTVLQPHVHELGGVLVEFRRFCRHHTFLSYGLYVMVLGVFLFLGLPFSSTLMVLAGIMYEFWEAVTLVMLCRLSVAALSFLVARRYIREETKNYYAMPRCPNFLKRFEHHQWLCLLLLRFAPVPDSVPNYSMAATSMTTRQYLAISLLGLVPISLMVVWLGSQLGSINRFISYLS